LDLQRSRPSNKAALNGGILLPSPPAVFDRCCKTATADAQSSMDGGSKSTIQKSAQRFPKGSGSIKKPKRDDEST
jgi:hypothetical protein